MIFEPRHRHLALAVVGVMGIFGCPRAWAQSFLFYGSPSTFESGLSQTNTFGATGVVNNPANILVSKRYQAYGDLSILNVTYSYTRPGSKPTTLTTTAPPVNMGGSWKPVSKLALGLFITPRPALSPQKISGLPFDQDGGVLKVDIENKQSSILTGIGFGLRLAPILYLGASVIETAEDSQIIVRKAGTTSDADAIAGLRFQGGFYQAQIGYRALIGKEVLLGGSFRTPVEKKYTGTEIIKGDEDSNIRRLGYNPSVLAVGAEYRHQIFALFGEVRREGWAAGANHFSSGLPGAASTVDFQDVYILVAGGRVAWREGHRFCGSFGYYPSNVGYGTAVTDSIGGKTITGVSFGEFDNLDRLMVSFSHRWSQERLQLVSGMNYITGSRTVPDKYAGAGKYALSVVTLGVGGQWKF
jgi:hypothetical protein